MSASPAQRGRAIVIGASMGGLMAARVLANHFSQVTVVERDSLSRSAAPRKGVPQGRHAHVLLARGRDLLESFFPGLTQELVEQGARTGDMAETSRWYSNGAYTRNFRSGLVGVQISRPLLESSVLRRLSALPNVTILERHEIVGLEHDQDPDGGAVITGVRVNDRSQPVESELVLLADLVVDASGRGTRSLTWLEALGYPRPEEELIKVNLAYTTREFCRRPEHAGGQSPIVILATPKIHRAAAMMAVEGDRWIVTLAGFLGEAAPPDLPEFIAYARTLAAPDAYEVIKDAEPLGEASLFKYPASQRRHFERLTRRPDRFLVIGDALCSFNPIYGQGMTTAAMEATILDECLAGGTAGLPARFYQRASALLDSPWSIAAGSDLGYPEVEGKRTPVMNAVGAYLNRLLRASQQDNVVNAAFQRVTNLMNPPASLFHPKIVWRVLVGNLRS